eukprot:CAMPEP_0202690726 /NCGR_PEP_ID=MMETSP1385-20130828/5632_1 /ASSEMBLY_ACC=CAM_ASM_000861 /TAXON_ID=933848 /ORGANISM="Elphidium margaritaceum" /LENGTH=194 /DNA_ID=CAMNT_0049346017 /DNA_START=79 /DNA_END=660 /DNA_ORIENTATION=-
MRNYACDIDVQYGDDGRQAIHCSPSISSTPPFSDHTPILNPIFNPAFFGSYNTFENNTNDEICKPSYSDSRTSSNHTSIASSEGGEYGESPRDMYTDDSDEIYTDFGIAYRQWCFSSSGIKLTMLLNATLIVVNTTLIVYEIALMVKTGSFSLYYDDRLPLIFLIFDVVLTLILFIEISLHLTAIYNCAVCNYW